MESTYEEYDCAEYIIDGIEALISNNSKGINEVTCDKNDWYDSNVMELFEKGNFLCAYDEKNQNHTYIAILNDKMLLFYPKNHKICLGPDADKCFVITDSYKRHLISIIDQENNTFIKTEYCMSFNHLIGFKAFESDKLPLNHVIKPTDIEEMRERINNLRIRTQLREQICSFNNEEVLKVLEFINNNLTNQQERQKVLSKK